MDNEKESIAVKESIIVIKQVIDNKQYMREYRKAHAEKWSTKKTCDICGGSYTLPNLTNHLNTNKHKYAVLEKEIVELRQQKSSTSSEIENKH